ncbi:ureidoglycolate lyase [Aliiroseovarius sp. 2305UL8-7]|uniref:ureidoglycolate lyase n=1 Tax=Aliiroseovarius conchicola TaxID=3121637 RepID=UPI003528677C
MSTLIAEPLTAEAFAPFGDVIELAGSPDLIINQGMCGRHHDLALLDFGTGRAAISLFDGKPRQFPYLLDMVERHPLGSQAFLPMNNIPLLVTVAEDGGGVPVNLRAFLTAPGQGINLHKGTWHGVLAPIGAQGLFAVVDRVGAGENLQEHWFDAPKTVEAPK